MKRLEGKIAVVTGAAGGIGSATAKKLAAEGASVAIVDINSEGAAAVAEEINSGEGVAVALKGDVSAAEDWERVVGEVNDRFGGIDVLHNNAALLSNAVLTEDLDVVSTDIEIWEAQLKVNLLGSLLGCKTVIPRMLERGGGSIINMSSISGLTGFENLSAYSATKAGIESLTRSVATQFGKRRIRANCIAPGTIKTPPNDVLWKSPAGLQLMESVHLTPYLGDPEHIANAVAFLASDEAAFVTGVVMPVDGGFLAHEPAFGRVREESDPS